MYPLGKYLAATAVTVLIVVAAASLSDTTLWKFLAVIVSVGLAVALRFVPKLRGYQFTAWIIAAVVAAMIYPNCFLTWGGFDLRNKWLILIVVQIVMFGMGTQMSLRDFSGVVKTPLGVGVGIVCHFTVMPLVGFGLTRIFHFEPEIAAGIILIGSCSSGLASNVMAYIAKSNLVLSVTVTAITTMLAPFLTPLWMKLLANKLVPTPYVEMMNEIIKITLVPIGAALLHDYLKHASPSGRRKVLMLAAMSAGWLAFIALGGWTFLKAHLASGGLTAIALFGFVLGAVIAGVVYHGLTLKLPKLDSWMPVASMFGIIYFTLVTTAAGREHLIKIGGLLFLAAALHNLAGYCFGYWLSRAVGLDKNSCRSIAFEVGLQNGGMATGIASKLGLLGTLGLAAAIFSPWMNVSGSLLANHWRKRP
jgi:BASS family bile acid:Na+ symporter